MTFVYLQNNMEIRSVLLNAGWRDENSNVNEKDYPLLCFTKESLRNKLIGKASNHHEFKEGEKLMSIEDFLKEYCKPRLETQLLALKKLVKGLGIVETDEMLFAQVDINVVKIINDLNMEELK